MFYCHIYFCSKNTAYNSCLKNIGKPFNGLIFGDCGSNIINLWSRPIVTRGMTPNGIVSGWTPPFAPKRDKVN